MRELIIEELKKEGYPKDSFEPTISKINEFHVDIKKLFEDWLENSTIPKIEIEGYSYDKLVQDFQMKPIGAFITLNWLKNEPEKAKKALEEGTK